mmetsp:Transcript_32943/g.52771  ORF Transcript_32943/g.52771 Transcript_32943/m.52771 type:complete len:299 (+) Transcript_32943:1-897(+)
MDPFQHNIPAMSPNSGAFPKSMTPTGVQPVGSLNFLSYPRPESARHYKSPQQRQFAHPVGISHSQQTLHLAPKASSSYGPEHHEVSISSRMQSPSFQKSPHHAPSSQPYFAANSPQQRLGQSNHRVAHIHDAMMMAAPKEHELDEEYETVEDDKVAQPMADGVHSTPKSMAWTETNNDSVRSFNLDDDTLASAHHPGHGHASTLHRISEIDSEHVMDAQLVHGGTAIGQTNASQDSIWSDVDMAEMTKDLSSSTFQRRVSEKASPRAIPRVATLDRIDEDENVTKVNAKVHFNLDEHQ